MDEQTIANRLKQNIPASEPAAAATTTLAPQEPQNTGFVDDMGENINMYKLYDFFTVDPTYRNGTAEQKVQTIYRWAADLAQSADYLAVANVISSHLQSIGAVGLGVSSLDKMYQYVKLEQQINYLKQEQGFIHG